MPTAVVHLADVEGFGGVARCYRLDAPKDFGDVVTDYVTVWIQRPFAHQDAEVALVPANETGGAATPSLKRRAGSYVLQDEPDTPEYVDGAFWLALQQLGGYDIAVEEPEAEPVEPQARTVSDGPFDPSEHIVSDVFDYLDTADDDEQARVIALERDGKARKSILARGK